MNNIIVNSWVRLDKGKIVARNWGDELNFYLLPLLSGRNFVPMLKATAKYTNFMCIGSLLPFFSNDKSVVWGSGVDNIENKRTLIKPAKVCAVRGPLTRQYLLSKGVSCPEIYGDPALLLPMVYDNPQEKKYKIGFIPHWSDMNEECVQKISKMEGVLLIDMRKYDKWTDIIDKIRSCEYIISESLHGLVVAEAYKIPNVWMKIKFDTQPTKYHDFFLSLGKDREKPLQIDNNTTLNQLLDACDKYERVFNLDLQPLIDSCPFQITANDGKQKL